jgi:hypothetical protein
VLFQILSAARAAERRLSWAMYSWELTSCFRAGVAHRTRIDGVLFGAAQAGDELLHLRIGHEVAGVGGAQSFFNQLDVILVGGEVAFDSLVEQLTAVAVERGGEGVQCVDSFRGDAEADGF